MFATFRLAASVLLLLFSKKDVPFLKRRILGSPSHVCYVSGLPQAFFLFLLNDMLFFFKVCFGQKLTFRVNILSIFVNIYQCTCLPYGTAYCTVLRTYLPVPYDTVPYLPSRTVRYCVHYL